MGQPKIVSGAGCVEELGSCVRCDTRLVTRVACFATCPGCRAENFISFAVAPLAERLARFWQRLAAPSGSVWRPVRVRSPRCTFAFPSKRLRESIHRMHSKEFS